MSNNRWWGWIKPLTIAIFNGEPSAKHYNLTTAWLSISQLGRVSKVLLICSKSSRNKLFKQMINTSRASLSQVMRLIKHWLILMLVFLMFCGVNAAPALAHRPHDDIQQLELTPTFQQDQTLLIIVRRNLYKSTDGGNHWQRIVRGLDNHGELSALRIASQTGQIAFVASLGDGIYKSVDGGESWISANTDLGTLSLDLLAISPTSADWVLAAGQEQGLYRTLDGAAYWSLVLPNAKVTAIAFIPTQPNWVMIGDRQGHLYQSSDQGTTWAKLTTIQPTGGISAIAISPNFDQDQTFWVGTDSGQVWQTVNSGRSFAMHQQGVTGGAIQDFAISPNFAQDQTLFLSTWSDGVFQSIDGGQTWTKRSQGLTKDHQADEEGFQLPHFSRLRLSNGFAQDQTVFVAGFNGLFKSLDAGQQWTELSTLSQGTVIALAISPNYAADSTLAIATYVGKIYISQDRGETWKLITKGLEVSRLTHNFETPHQDPRRFFDLAFSSNYTQDNTLFSTLLWTKVLKSTNGGNWWQIIPLSQEARGLSLALSPQFAIDQTVYVATQAGKIFWSTNGGDRFELRADIGKFLANDPPSLVISPAFATDQTLFTTGALGVYKSVDQGKTWTPLMQNTDLSNRRQLQLAISPDYPTDQTLLLGTNQGIYISRDGGTQWQQWTQESVIANGVIEAVMISPNYATDQTIIVSVRGHGLLQTTDNGTIFSPIGDDALPLRKVYGPPSAGIPIQFSPNYATDKTLYGFGAADTTIFRSTDAGQIWTALTVPEQDEPQSLLTDVSLYFYVYRGRFLRVGIAIIVAIATYFLLGMLTLHKHLFLNRTQLRVLGSLSVFLVILLLSLKL